MVSADLSTLRAASAWLHAGHSVFLFTVVRTWGSAPRPVGALAAIREDGLIEGSISGGCIEDDLVERIRQGLRVERPQEIRYGLTSDEAHRFGLPCGGTLQLVCERIGHAGWIDALLARCDSHQLVMRELSMHDGSVHLSPARRGDELAFDGQTLRAPHGPRWRLLLIGAGQLSQYVARIAATLDFEIFICDPREEYASQREGKALPDVHYVEGMPDDAVVALAPDPHTAVVALTHDPKLDDMALLEALKSEAFYVGALGSGRNTAARKERLALFDLDAAQIARLHGPVGLRIGSRTPPEIAVSVMAEIIAVRSASARHQPVNLHACELAPESAQTDAPNLPAREVA